MRGSTGKVDIVYPADPEAEIFGERVGAVITDAGWQVGLVGGMSFGPVFGFILTTRDADKPTAATVALRSALESAFGGGEVSVQPQASMKQEELRLS